MDAQTPPELLLCFSDWPWGQLKPHGYDLLMIDPPWPNKLRSPKGEKKSSLAHYGKMSFDEIAALPVQMLASPNCVILLWCTWPLLLHGGDPAQHYRGHDAAISHPGRCLKAWGARYATGGAWRKTTVHGKVAFGTGYRLRSACEPFLIGIIGAPFTTRSERNIFDGLAREHSRKPETAYAMCERWMSQARRRAELFSRTSRPGWDTWGFEAGKYDPVVSIGGARP